MNASRLRALALAIFPLAGAGYWAGCSSSSTPNTSTTPDASHAEDTGAPKADAKHTSDSGHASKPDAGHDSGAKADAGVDAAPADAGVDAPGCPGVDASLSGLEVSQACVACAAQKCCSQAIACEMGAGCKQIEVCATKCIAGGTAAKQCATDCILWDGGTPPDGTSTTDLTPGQNAAEQLDLCLLVACQGICAS